MRWVFAPQGIQLQFKQSKASSYLETFFRLSKKLLFLAPLAGLGQRKLFRRPIRCEEDFASSNASNK